MLNQKQSQLQQQKIDPKIIIANTILQLSNQELQQAVEQELAENPALEQENEEPCAGCELAPFLCKNCKYKQETEEEPVTLSGSNDEYIFDFSSDPDDQNDVIGRIRADFAIEEHLRNQLRNLVSGKILDLADYLINYIDESGYLSCDLLELTLEVDASDDEIAEALAIVQTLDPPGVGARDLRECLLIQLRFMREDGKEELIAERMIEDYWEELKNRKYNRIARKLKVSLEKVMAKVQFIQTSLHPYPASGFRTPWDNKHTDTKTSVKPDVIIHRTPIGYEIEVVSHDHLSLTVNPYYRQVYNEMRNGNEQKFSGEEKKHISEFVERADFFIKNLAQRRKTLRNITKYIVEYQLGFLETSQKSFLRPLTRVKVAKHLKIHESTVSRATSNKYIQLPNQEVLPFDFFFHSSHSISDAIVQMIEQEDPAKPLSDQDIANALNAQGRSVARRTIVKYREAHKILSSRQRRKKR